MSRQHQAIWRYLALLGMVLSGCHPIQPFYFGEDGDLSHYLDVATDIEFADANVTSPDEHMHAIAPLTLKDADELQTIEKWELTLEEAVRIALENGDVLKLLGGLVTSTRPETLARQNINTNNVATVYDAAIVESGYGGATGSPLSGIGVEAALAEFDARLDSSITWNHNDRPQNANTGLGSFQPQIFVQESANFTAGITKQTAPGGSFFVRNNTFYDANNNPTRVLRSDWNTNLEMGFAQPLLQGRGTQYNRIAGTHAFNAFTVGNPNSIDGVMIARIRTDLALADFEAGVRDFLEDIEEQYWDLHCAYQRVRTAKTGRDSALNSWQKTSTERRLGTGGTLADVAQAKAQYYSFRGQLETAVHELLRAEARLRYSMGKLPSDGRLIRPADEPTIAQVNFAWEEIHAEAMCRRVELRKKKWEIKRRELELIASRNHMLPRLDATGTYRWLGLGDDLIDTSRSGLSELAPGSNAFESLTGGNFQEWQLGLIFNMPIGFRAEMAQIRHHQLLLAREKALYATAELEVLHQLSESVREVEAQYIITQTNFNGLVSAEDEVEEISDQVQKGLGQVQIDLLLDAQRRRAIAEDTYYRSLCEYNKAIMRIHREKGTLLEYNGVYLAEGPWTGKAYFDALRRARKRDASTYLDYGFTRPNVVSQGPVQHRSEGHLFHDLEGEVIEGPALNSGEYYTPGDTEEIPAPQTAPQSAPQLNGPRGEPGTLPPPTTSASVTPNRTKSVLFAAPSDPPRPTAQSRSHESDAHHATFETASDSAGGKRTQRQFPGAGVRR